jgi:3-hydroxyisobutyrate dehydrogenase
MQIGLAGLGTMGAAMAHRLIEVGRQVSVWNRSLAKTKPLADAGARVAASPADLVAEADTVIAMLTDAAATDAVYDSPSGLLSGDVRGKLFIDMSTVTSET